MGNFAIFPRKSDMKKLLLLLFILISAFNTKAQIHYWTSTFAGSGTHTVKSVSVDSLGNVYSIGTFTGSADFDPSPNSLILNSVGNSDCFVSCMNSGGQLLWAKNFGSNLADDGNAICLDANRNIYITGSFQGTVSFIAGNPSATLTAAGSFDGFLAKLDFQGNVIWAKAFSGSSGSEEPASVTCDKSGAVYVGGIFQGTADFDPGTTTLNLTSSGSNDMFIAKLNPNGNLIRATTLGGSLLETLGSLQIDQTGNLVICGSFRGTVDFDVNAGVQNRTANTGFTYDNFILKWDSSFGFVWAQTFGGTGADLAKQVCIGANNSVVLTGYYAGTVDFDPGPGNFQLSSTGVVNVFVASFQANGTFSWAASLGGNSNQNGIALCTDDIGSIYAGGWFKDTADFDPGIGVYPLIAIGAEDGYVCKLNASGQFEWAYSLGSAGFESVNALICNLTTRNIIASGQFSNTVDFDPGSAVFSKSSAGSTDGFLNATDMFSPILPVLFTHFSIQVDATKLIWNWECAFEKNNQGFFLEESEDGIQFSRLAFVKGAGNSLKTSKYQYYSTQSNSIYYRIAQVDFDGSINYSKTLEIGNKLESNNPILINPVENQLQFRDPVDCVSWEIISKDGVLVKQGQTGTSANEPIRVEELTSGLYLLIMKTEFDSFYIRFLKN